MSALRISKILFAAAAAWLVLPVIFVHGWAQERARDEALLTVESYLKARLARDFDDAYRYLSRRDQRVRSRERYVRESGAYRGFALELSRGLVAGLELSVLERAQTATRARIKVRFRLPAAADVSPLVWNWDPVKLAALGAREQEKIVQALEKSENAGKLARIESQETFNLRKEGSQWRIFLDWASGVNVTFGFLPATGDIDVRFSEQWIVAQVGVPFQIAFTVANRSAVARTIKIAHRIAPQPIAEHLEMIQCGLLSPVTLAPGSAHEFSSAYILAGDFPAAVKDVKIVYAYEADH